MAAIDRGCKGFMEEKGDEKGVEKTGFLTPRCSSSLGQGKQNSVLRCSTEGGINGEERSRISRIKSSLTLGLDLS